LDKKDDSQEEMKTQVVSLGSFAFQISVNREEIRTGVSAVQHKIEAVMKCSEEETMAAIDSIRSKPDETHKRQIKDVLSYIDQWTCVIHMELSEKIEQTQLGLQAVTTQTQNPCEDLLTTKTELQGALDHNIQETQADILPTKALVVPPNMNSGHSWNKSKLDLRRDLTWEQEITVGVVQP
jgi:hypothetical protein